MRGALLLVALASLPAHADDGEPPPPTPFDQGRVAITAGGGTTSSLGHHYKDLDTIGARAGGLLISGRIVFGLGVVVEHVLTTCTSEGPRCVDADDSVYPDVTFGFTL